ncbi:MAG: hypothetical protein KGS72_08895 [Cyanobacteria bacterium REEB67]|nr:hypothetical protein [Cyanobacteria bacterium REEB67]
MSKSTSSGAVCNDCAGRSGCPVYTGSEFSAPQPASSTPAISVIAGINPGHQHGVEYDQADLLILTKALDVDLGPGPLAFDEHHDRAISKAIAASDFRGAARAHLAIAIPAVSARASDASRHIVVIGLGKADRVTRRSVCDVFADALNFACQFKSQSLLLPIFPQRSSEGTINLRGTGAILRCLVDEKVRRGALGQLKEICLLCAPQAKRHLQDGLVVERILCGTCRRPD